MAKKVALITGSVRTPRAGTDVVAWVDSVLKTRPTDDLKIEPLVISDFNLPIYDETVMPAMVPHVQQFSHEHSKKWSAAIASFDAYIFVVPEYNAGLAGGTKNAIDYLKNEWAGRPVAIVSYGVNGGDKANEHLALSLGLVMQMRVIEPRVLLPFAKGNDVGTAVTTGKIGEGTLNGWDAKKDDILKAVAQIVTALEGLDKADEVAEKV